MLSKLRSICVISRQVQDVSDRRTYNPSVLTTYIMQDVNTEMFNNFKNIPTSPLKKIKRTVGYGTSNDHVDRAGAALKRMRLTDTILEDERRMSD